MAKKWGWEPTAELPTRDETGVIHFDGFNHVSFMLSIVRPEYDSRGDSARRCLRWDLLLISVFKNTFNDRGYSDLPNDGYQASPLSNT